MKSKNGRNAAVALLAVTLIVAGGSVSAQEFQLPDPEVTELAPGVHHMWIGGGSTLIVVSGQDVLITDTYNNLVAQLIQGVVASLTDNPVSHVVLSHEHYDHVGGTGMFPDATVYCHVNCQPIFDLADPAITDVPDVDETFTDFTRIAVGGIPVELHYLGPGDGDATTIVYLPEQKVVVTSDMYEEMAISDAGVVDDKNFTGTRKILNEISGWEVEHAVNAHSASTDPQVLMATAQYLNDLYDAVREALVAAQEQGGPFAGYSLMNSLPDSLELPQYSEWGNYDTSFSRHVERMLLSIFHGD